MPEAEVRRIAAERYGLTGEFTRFATEKDDTFRIRTDAGRAVVLKIANPAEPRVDIDFQIQLLRHVERTAPAIPVPRVLADREGRLYSDIRADDGTERIVRVVSYLEGTPLDGTTSSASQRERVGETLARLRHATASFSHPGEARVLAWDVQHFLKLEPLLAGVDDGSQRRQLRTALDRFARMTPGLHLLRRQVLHNDFSRSNIVVDHANPAFVNGVIDFGDAVRTAVVVDVATAVLNQLPSTPAEDIFTDARDLVRGYLGVADLTDQELLFLPHLAMARTCTRILLSIWLARIFPQNAKYVMRNTPASWVQLEWFLGRGADEVGDSLMRSKVAPRVAAAT